MMKPLPIFCLLLFARLLPAQTGCPGCLVNLPPLPTDTVYLPPIPDGQVGVAYDQDISFRLPKTTTPVSVIDSTTPPGLTINSIEITSVTGLPPGLSWQPNQTVFQVGTQTDGCIKICGVPTLSDSFVIQVKLKASVFIFTQEAEFPMRMYIAPGVSVNEGFEMTAPTGCGSTEVGFTNNIPSNGNPGFTYNWDFGDGTTFEGENPPPHRYDSAGLYVVSYQALIDTIGFVLDQIILQNLECADLLGLGAPDVYILIKNEADSVVFNSGTAIGNISLPAAVNIGLPLTQENYTMEVWDEDGGLKGGDDACGIFTFNYLNNGPVVAGGFAGVLNIAHPITELNYTDTVIVYPTPPQPPLSAPLGNSVCADAAPLPLVTQPAEGLFWQLNGTIIDNFTDTLYLAETSGFYQTGAVNGFGCTNLSDSVWIEILALPATPIFVNNNNVLTLFDTLALPAAYQLEWYQDGQLAPINSFWFCITESGTYTLVLTDVSTGCTSSYSVNAIYNPNFDCTTDVTALVREPDVHLYPNPASQRLTIQAGNMDTIEHVLVWDAAGRLIYQHTSPLHTPLLELNCSDWTNGLHRLQVSNSRQVWNGTVLIQR